MSNSNETDLDFEPLDATQVELNNVSHPAWDEPIICRVEVDLPGWLSQLAGGTRWEVYSEDEDENCISFSLRELGGKSKSQATPKLAVAHTLKTAEVTLYHNGYAVVDVEGQAIFDGALTNGTSDCAHLSYYHADTGEPIILN
jgi:hypothetical protein